MSERRRRIGALDVIRGFALCGILLANVGPISNINGKVVPAGTGGWTGYLVDHRFFPVFAVLFGVGFALLLESAGGRTARPRLLLVRRLLVLLAVGLLHMFLIWPGDVLAIYALSGLVFLLPSTWLPRWAVAVLAVVILVASLFVTDGYLLAPGLLLVGAALVRYGVIDRIESSAKGPAIAGALLATAAAPALALQIALQASGPAGRATGVAMAVAGMLIGGVYVCVLLLLLRTPLRAALHAIFAPLGRMALTNYLTASVLVLAVAHLHGHPQDWTQPAILAVVAGVLAAQWLFSTLWLRRHRFGPLEWLWRWATWGRRPALRRA
ncbi:DUF418 domain-containing protein [Nonomuraea candida]|uniref:DUF418 domain-containing protein n=1 Tax=Nonomuraea candida TaxID=359159 RepID=UPI00069369D2|nr:DUF418 domain-containing protein [Nonomuraea candida]